MIAFDTETHLIRPGVLVPRLVCLTIAWGAGDRPSWVPTSPGVVERDGVALLDAAAALGVIPALLAADEIVAANAPYDLAVLARHRPDALTAVFRAVEEGRVRDVQVRERLLLVAEGRLAVSRVDLASLVSRYLGRDISASKGADTWRTRYGELDGVPLTQWPEEALRYALDDAALTLEVYRAQSARSEVDGVRVVEGGRVVSEERELRAAWALHLMAAYGLRTDPVAVSTLEEEWTREVAAGRIAGERGGWVRTAPPARAGTVDKKRLQAVISEAFGGSPPITAPSTTYPRGQVKTDAETLEEAAARAPADLGVGALLRTYAGSLSAAKAQSVWAEALRAGTVGPLTSRPSHLVETGRTAWSGPPLQQPPRAGGVRECFVPRPGFVLCSVDYHVAELCALAQIHIWWGLGDTMARAINAGADLHLVVAAQIERTDYDTIRARYKAGDPVARRARQLAKVANFGFPGGLGANSFVAYARGQGVDVTAADARALRDTWRRSWPEMAGYFDRINRLLGSRDSFSFVHSVSGRVRGGVGYCDGCNGPFQGLVADGAKDAAWALSRAAYTGEGHPRAGDLLGVRPVLFLHDEILAEIPEHRAHDGAEAMAEIMVDRMQAHIPDVTIKAEPALMRRWYKKAETVRDASGRLIPWVPSVGEGT